ncbi:MAG TPA: hypothetical protein VF844_00505, partial [Ktedonobacteraceae bacterium]
MYTMRSIRSTQTILAGVLIGIMLLTSACGGSPQSQQQVNQNKAKLDQTLQHARSIGVPASALQSILKQEQQLASTGAPFTLFNDQPATDYNTRLAGRYEQLEIQAEGVISAITAQYSLQAQQDMLNFESALSTIQSKHVGNMQAFSTQYSTDTTLLAAAQYPKDYAAVSNDAHMVTETLAVLGTTYAQLNTFKNT